MVTSLKIGGHLNLWTGKMLSIEMAVEVQILQQILQDLQVILQKMILRYSLSMAIQVVEFSNGGQRYTYRVLQTIQMKLILLCVWAELAVLGSTKTALKHIYEIEIS